MAEIISMDDRNMSVSQEKLFEESSELQRVTIRFRTEEADLEAQEILGRMGRVQYLSAGRVRITRRMLEALEEKHILFELAAKPTPIGNALRKQPK